MRPILVNGLARSGKDTFVSELAKLTGIEQFSIGTVIKKCAHALYWQLYYGTDSPWPWYVFNSVKDEPRPEFLGRTPRDVYIGLHEHMKACHGPTVMAKALLSHIQHLDTQIAITDIGNDAESAVFAEHWPEAITIRIHRENTLKDNRRLISEATLDFHNNGSVEDIAPWIRTNLLPLL